MTHDTKKIIAVLDRLITKLEKLKLLLPCPHDNTIDVGDEDHLSVTCIDCHKDVTKETTYYMKNPYEKYN